MYFTYRVFPNEYCPVPVLINSIVPKTVLQQSVFPSSIEYSFLWIDSLQTSTPIYCLVIAIAIAILKDPFIFNGPHKCIEEPANRKITDTRR